MRIRWALRIPTEDEWQALPDNDRLDLLAWDAYRERTAKDMREALAKPDEKSKNGKLTPEAWAILLLAQLGY